MHPSINADDLVERHMAQKRPTKAGSVKVTPVLAKMLVELDPDVETTIFVIKSPMAGTEYAPDIRGEKNIYGVKLVEGVGVSADREIVERICREFPDYTYSEA